MNKLIPLTDEQCQHAVDALAKNDGKVGEAAQSLGMVRSTFQGRVAAAEKRGIKSFFWKPQLQTIVQAVRSASVGRKHMVIPDGQVKKGVPLEHWTCIGQYMVDKKPDVVVNIGDFGDMPSLSSYDKGKRGFEGRRYKDDIEAVHEAMGMLMAPLRDYNRRNPQAPYNPELELTLGNHEYRIIRATEEAAEFFGTIGVEDLQYEKFGWRVHPFLEPIEIDGVLYAHYFTTGVMGRPVTTARALVTKKHMSCTMGHVQKTDIDMSQLRADGKQIIGLFAGCCYLHDEDYLGPQGNSDRRQIVMCHEVDDGDYDPMFVSLKYLKKRYS